MEKLVAGFEAVGVERLGRGVGAGSAVVEGRPGWNNSDERARVRNKRTRGLNKTEVRVGRNRQYMAYA